MEYTVISIGQKEIQNFASRIWFDSKESAERYAEGMTAAYYWCGKKWAVVMLPDGEYDPKTAITKNLTSKQADILFKNYKVRIAKSLPA